MSRRRLQNAMAAAITLLLGAGMVALLVVQFFKTVDKQGTYQSPAPVLKGP